MFDEATTAFASANGAYTELAPIPPLRAHFQCVWFHRIAQAPRQPLLVLPDGCVDLVWIDGVLSVAGRDRTAATPLIPPGATVVGLRFQPGAASTWLQLPMSELVDRRILLDELGGAWTRSLAARADGITPDRAVELLQRELISRAAEMPKPDPSMLALFGQLRLPEGPVHIGVARASAQLNLSERTLRRRSQQEFGYGPKTLERILRFQGFLRRALTSPHTSLALTAIESGYADQAHLTRECQRLSGRSPREIIAQRAALAGRFVQDASPLRPASWVRRCREEGA